MLTLETIACIRCPLLAVWTVKPVLSPPGPPLGRAARRYCQEDDRAAARSSFQIATDALLLLAMARAFLRGGACIGDTAESVKAHFAAASAVLANQGGGGGAAGVSGSGVGGGGGGSESSGGGSSGGVVTVTTCIPSSPPNPGSEASRLGILNSAVFIPRFLRI
jgi:hypothetical protein